MPLLMPSAKLQTFSQSICDGIRHILHFIIFISVVTLLRIDFPHFPVSFEAAIMRQSWYPGHVGDSTGFRRFEDLPTANFSDNGLPTRKVWVSRYPPFFHCSCTSQFTKDQRQSLRLLPSAYFQYHCHRSDLRGPKGTQKKRSEIVMKDSERPCELVRSAVPLVWRNVPWSNFHSCAPLLRCRCASG